MAAAPADTIWEIQNGGADTNGGGFSAANAGATGTDHTQSAATSLTVTTTGTTTITATVGAFDNTMLGNAINIAGDGIYFITAFTSSSVVTVHAATGTAVGSSAKVGGAFASIGAVSSINVAGNIIWIKFNASPFVTTNRVSGVVSLAVGTATTPVLIRGYDVTRGDETANRPTLQWGVNALQTYLVSGNSFGFIENIVFDGNRANFTNTRGFVLVGGVSRRCKVMNCSGSNFIGWSTGDVLMDLEVTNCTQVRAASSSGAYFFNCYFHDNLAGVFSFSTGSAYFLDCIFDTNAGNGVLFTGGGTYSVINCVFYNHTGTFSGISFTTLAPNSALIANCAFESNTAYGVNFAAAYNEVTMLNNAFYNNTTAKYPGTSTWSYHIVGEIIPTGTMFTDAPNGDFSLNNTANQGRLLRGTAFPQTMAGGLTASRSDVGSAQHSDPVAGALMLSAGMDGGVN